MSEYRAQLFSAAGPYLFLSPALYSLPSPAFLVWAPGCARSAALCEWPGVFWDLSCTRSPRPSPKVHSLLVISCTVSAVSGHLLYCVRSLWSSPVLCPQSLVISCTVSA
ncbi:unnamed protein product, partial [Staurois parvus]